MYGIFSSHPSARVWEIYFQDFLHSFFLLYRETLLATMQKLRRAKEGVEEGVGWWGGENMRTESLLGDPKPVESKLE
jgi:hypothetical protein